MKQFKNYIALLVLLTIFWSSGGATVYSHFCKGANIAISSYVEIDHNKIEQECLKEKPVKTSCHETEQEEPCCSDKVEFDTFEQVQSEYNQFVFHPFFVCIIPSVEEFKLQQQFGINNTYFNKPPPGLTIKKSILFQQFLC